MIWIHILILSGLLIAAILIMMLKRLKESRFEEADQSIKGTTLVRDNNANFAGLASRGGKQIRGNGILILTNIELYFIMWLPHKVISIPVRDIEKVDLTKSHAGRWSAYPMLHIIWNKEEKTEGAAWATTKKEEFVHNIEQLIAQTDK